MSIGKKFLERVLAEAKSTEGFEFDRGTEAMKNALRDIGGENNFADKIAEVFNMCGISGTYMNKRDVKDSIIEAATELRSKPARVRAFLALHSALLNLHEGATSVEEAEDTEELEGQGFQQFVEECLVSLGLPESFVGASAKAAIKAGLRKASALIRSDRAAKKAFVDFGRYSGVKLNDGTIGGKKRLGEGYEINGRTVKAGSKISWKDDDGEHIGTVVEDPKYNGGLRVGGRSLKNIIDDSDEVEVIKEATAIGTSGTIGTDDQSDNAIDYARDPVAAAMQVLSLLGVDLSNNQVVRVVNQMALNRSIKTACRNPAVKRGLAAFLRANKEQ